MYGKYPKSYFPGPRDEYLDHHAKVFESMEMLSVGIRASIRQLSSMRHSATFLKTEAPFQPHHPHLHPHRLRTLPPPQHHIWRERHDSAGPPIPLRYEAPSSPVKLPELDI